MTDSLWRSANSNICNINLVSIDNGSDELDIYRSLFIFKNHRKILISTVK